MGKEKLRQMPFFDPLSGAQLYVSELTCDDSGIVIRGRFEIPRIAALDEDQASFLETFLRCRGMLNSVEKELGISYPTARARLDTVLGTLGLSPFKEDGQKRSKIAEKKHKILDQLEKGEITAEEAKVKLGVGGEK